MNKLLSAILAGVFAATLSAGAFAADEAPAAPASEIAKEKPAAPLKKAKHHHKKALQKEAAAPEAAK